MAQAEAVADAPQGDGILKWIQGNVSVINDIIIVLFAVCIMLVTSPCKVIAFSYQVFVSFLRKARRR